MLKQSYYKYIHSVLFIVILIPILYYSSMIFIPKNNLDGFGMRDISANGILSEKDDSLDVLILGDSEAYSSFSPMEIYHHHGITSYVCATSGQPLYYTKSLLERTLKTQSPQVVVIETNAIFRNFSSAEPLADKISELFPVFDYHDRWKSLNSDDFTGTVNYTYNNVLKGFNYNTSILKVNSLDGYMAKTDKKATIPFLNRYLLDSMVQTCKDRDIEVVLVSTPSPVNWDSKKHNCIEHYAHNRDIRYVDLNDSKLVSIDWQKDTRDAGDHLNYAGAKKVTAFLGKYLQETFILPDHRQDEFYGAWNKSWEDYKKIVKEYSSK